jgi:hypothetical protein
MTILLGATPAAVQAWASRTPPEADAWVLATPTTLTACLEGTTDASVSMLPGWYRHVRGCDLRAIYEAMVVARAHACWLGLGAAAARRQEQEIQDRLWALAFTDPTPSPVLPLEERRMGVEPGTCRACEAEAREHDPLPPLEDTDLDESRACCGETYATHAAWYRHFKVAHPSGMPTGQG